MRILEFYMNKGKSWVGVNDKFTFHKEKDESGLTPLTVTYINSISLWQFRKLVLFMDELV